MTSGFDAQNPAFRRRDGITNRLFGYDLDGTILYRSTARLKLTPRRPYVIVTGRPPSDEAKVFELLTASGIDILGVPVSLTGELASDGGYVWSGRTRRKAEAVKRLGCTDFFDDERVCLEEIRRTVPGIRTTLVPWEAEDFPNPYDEQTWSDDA